MTETGSEKRLSVHPRVSTKGQVFESQLAQLRTAGRSGWNIA